MLQLAIYSVLIVAASLVGGWLPSLVTLTHKRMQVMMSAVGGLMLGIAIFHMLPHALEMAGRERTNFVTLCMMAGLVTMFLMLRMFHFHHHDPGDLADDDEHSHDHDDDHDGGHGHGHAPSPVVPHELSWLGVFLGLGLHTFIDGIALAASVQANPAAGVGTFLAIVAHKPLDAVSIASLMSAGQWSASARLLASASFALMCPFGAAVFYFGAASFSLSEELILASALAFSAGVFLCISLSDLLPEMEFHSHHRLLLTASLLAGIALAWLVHWLEPGHRREAPTGQNPNAVHSLKINGS